MSCYYPIVMELRADVPFSKRGVPLEDIVDLHTGEARYKWKYTGRHVSRSELETISQFYDENNTPPFKLVPCGKCIGCRLDKSRQWADRMMVELDHSKKGVFLTLTYRDDALKYGEYDPDFNCEWATVDKEHIQLFNKRLRENFSRRGIPEIRFYISSEYGPKTLRPHYHGCYFGFSLDDIPDCKFRKLNRHKQPLYHSDWLDSIWQNGDVTIAPLSWQNCAYTARYTLKKLGCKALCQERRVEPEFALMSRRPGIGGFYTIDHPEYFDNPRDPIYFSDPHGLKQVTSCSCPKFVFKKLQLTNPALYNTIIEERQKFSDDKYFSELLYTDLDDDSYLRVKELSHEKSSNILHREFSEF